MNRQTARLLPCLALALAWLGPVAARAQEPVDYPQRTPQQELRYMGYLVEVKNVHDMDYWHASSMLWIAQDNTVLAAAALGDNWSALTTEEQKLFSKLIEHLVRHANNRMLRKLIGRRVEIATIETKADATFIRFIAQPSNQGDEAINFAFKIVPFDLHWKIHDIITEDVSLVRSYRSQFTKILKQDGFPALVEKIRARLKLDEAEEDPEREKVFHES